MHLIGWAAVMTSACWLRGLIALAAGTASMTKMLAEKQPSLVPFESL